MKTFDDLKKSKKTARISIGVIVGIITAVLYGLVVRSLILDCISATHPERFVGDTVFLSLLALLFAAVLWLCLSLIIYSIIDAVYFEKLYQKILKAHNDYRQKNPIIQDYTYEPVYDVCLVRRTIDTGYDWRSVYNIMNHEGQYLFSTWQDHISMINNEKISDILFVVTKENVVGVPFGEVYNFVTKRTIDRWDENALLITNQDNTMPAWVVDNYSIDYDGAKPGWIKIYKGEYSAFVSGDGEWWLDTPIDIDHIISENNCYGNWYYEGMKQYYTKPDGSSGILTVSEETKHDVVNTHIRGL